MAKLYFRYGAMNAGKSTALMQVAHNYNERGMDTIIMKPQVDTKADSKISSRLGIEKDVDILIKPNDDILSLIKEYQSQNYTEVSCILIDESQFLTKEQVDDLIILASFYSIPVLCYGLRTDFTGHGFEGSTRLLEIADIIEELKTICNCGKKATFNLRKVNNIPTTTGEQIEIDNQDKIEYIGMCAKCYFETIEKYNI